MARSLRNCTARALFAALLGSFVGAAGAAAQDYPNRAVRMIVPYPAGGATDIVARVMQLEAPAGRICAVGGGDLVLVVVAEPAVNVGLVRVEMLRAVGDLLAVGGEAA